MEKHNSRSDNVAVKRVSQIGDKKGIFWPILLKEECSIACLRTSCTSSHAAVKTERFKASMSDIHFAKD